MNEVEMMQYLKEVSSDVAALSRGVAEIGKAQLDAWDVLQAVLLSFSELDPRFGGAFEKNLGILLQSRENPDGDVESRRVLAVLLRRLRGNSGMIQ